MADRIIGETDYAYVFMRKHDDSRQAAALDIFFSTLTSVAFRDDHPEKDSAGALLWLFDSDKADIGMDISKGAISVSTLRSIEGSRLLVNVPPSFFNVVTYAGAQERSTEETREVALGLIRQVFESPDFKSLRQVWGLK